ncbi:hypothetical protein SLE2022_190130 [Rubroshorea leprosula]
MLTLTIFFILLLHLLLPTTTTAPAYNATDIILLDCGSPSNSTSDDGRNWDADLRSIYSSFNDPNSSFSLHASHQDPSVSTFPYLSALIIKSKFTYSFPVSPGPKFLRLYFYPEKYDTFDMTASFFNVTANSYTLLKNFSAYLHLMTNEGVLIKEFIVPVWDNEILNVTFIPSRNSYAFINGIEIVSMPSDLYLSRREIPLVISEVVGQSFFLDNTSTSLETLYRLNVGGNFIDSVEDTGMYRTWSQDGGYLFDSNWIIPLFLDQCQRIHFPPGTPAYTAPREVYTSLRMMSENASLNLNSNMTWKFSVDAGFHYLIRLHFCELLSQVVGPSVFDIFINNQTAATNIDVFHLSGGNGHPMYRDYIVMADNSTRGEDLWLALHPQNKGYVDAFLNGLEIFKLNQSDGNLAGPNPDSHQKLLEGPKSKLTSIILPVIGAILGGFALVSLLVSFFVFQRQRKLKHSLSFTSKFITTKTSSSLPSDICCQFSIAEIKAATQDFDDALLIGSGGFGNVYRGIMKGGTTIAAIKRLNPSSRQGAHEFHTEIALLSKLRHINLVSLIGYCDDHSEMILVYDYMARGTLRNRLDKTKNLPLSWKRRLEICIGAARGLHYLHREVKEVIIHRDVKSSNILLDEHYVAKVSDFGLSKLGPTSTSETHVSTMVKGSFGYIDPEYFRLQRLTDKSDVYSFGVVLFEVLCGKPPVFENLSGEKVGLAQWAHSCYQNGSLDEIVDPYLAGQIAPMALQKFSEVAENCVRERGNERPTMRDIVWALESTLQLQETEEENTNDSDAIITDEGSSQKTVKSLSISDYQSTVN